MNYGYNITTELQNFKIKIKKEVERLTSMNVKNVELLAKGLNVPNNNIK